MNSTSFLSLTDSKLLSILSILDNICLSRDEKSIEADFPTGLESLPTLGVAIGVGPGCGNGVGVGLGDGVTLGVLVGGTVSRVIFSGVLVSSEPNLCPLGEINPAPTDAVTFPIAFGAAAAPIPPDAFTGCTTYSPYHNNFDTRMFYANMKPSLENYGKKAAVYDNRIYYLSAEEGSQGIYSMLLDGTDVQPEFEVKDIRSLTVTSNGFYYSGFAHISVNDNGEYRCFHLLYRETTASNPINLLSQAENAELLEGDNVWDFYLKEDGSIYLRIPQILFFSGLNGITISTLYNGRILTLPEYNIMLNNLEAFDNSHQQSGLVIYQHENQLFPLSSEINAGEERVEIFDKRNVSLFDETKSMTILPIDALFLSDTERYDGPYSDRWILRFCDEKMLLAYEAGLYEYRRLCKQDRHRRRLAVPLPLQRKDSTRRADRESVYRIIMINETEPTRLRFFYNIVT